MKEFNKIKDMNEDLSTIEDKGNSNIYLTLSSSSIPYEWCNLFNETWKDNMHSQWKPARAEGDNYYYQLPYFSSSQCANAASQ